MPKQIFSRLVQEQKEVGGVFEPEVIAMMSDAFDRILLDFINRDDPLSDSGEATD